ncbi:hypothetical protein HDV05_006361, partial [Chytridiales sp. JEL 0842]
MDTYLQALQTVNMTQVVETVVSQPAVDTFLHIFSWLETTLSPHVDPYLNLLVAQIARYIPLEYQSQIASFLETAQSPLAARLPLMNPAHVLAIAAGYLLVIAVGCTLMKVLPKFEVKGLMMLHNLAMVSL